MIQDAVARIQAIEQKLTGKSLVQLQARLTIRGCLKELRDISPDHPATPQGSDGVVRQAHWPSRAS
jgi:hypothetical protein